MTTYKHYSIHGTYELTREPNKYFKNHEFYNLYPWALDLDLNPFYLFLSWPEEFIEYADFIKRRFEADEVDTNNFSWDRSFSKINTIIYVWIKYI